MARIQSGGRKLRAKAATATKVVKVAKKLQVRPSPFGKRASMKSWLCCFVYHYQSSLRQELLKELH